MLLSDTGCRMRQSLTNEGFLHVRGEKKHSFSTPAQRTSCLVGPLTLYCEAFVRALFTNFGVVTVSIPRP